MNQGRRRIASPPSEANFEEVDVDENPPTRRDGDKGNDLTKYDKAQLQRKIEMMRKEIQAYSIGEDSPVKHRAVNINHPQSVSGEQFAGISSLVAGKNPAMTV